MPQNRPRRRPRLLRRAHYWIGLSLAAPLVLLAATGILLNHSSDLQLDTRYSGAQWLLNLYGVEVASPKTGFAMGDQWVSQARDRLWLNSRQLDSSASQLLGAVELENLLVIAFADRLQLYTDNGVAVETLPVPSAIRPLRGITRGQDRLLAHGNNTTLSTTADFLRWQPYSGAWPGIRTAQNLPERLRTEIAARLSAQTLTWEKILLDLHSGRIFGTWGPLFVDLIALVTIILAITGCLLWARRRR